MCISIELHSVLSIEIPWKLPFRWRRYWARSREILIEISTTGRCSIKRIYNWHWGIIVSGKLDRFINCFNRFSNVCKYKILRVWLIYAYMCMYVYFYESTPFWKQYVLPFNKTFENLSIEIYFSSVNISCTILVIVSVSDSSLIMRELVV